MRQYRKKSFRQLTYSIKSIMAVYKLKIRISSLPELKVFRRLKKSDRNKKKRLESLQRRQPKKKKKKKRLSRRLEKKLKRRQDS